MESKHNELPKTDREMLYLINQQGIAGEYSAKKRPFIAERLF
jgi:hypothetical protein